MRPTRAVAVGAVVASVLVACLAGCGGSHARSFVAPPPASSTSPRPPVTDAAACDRPHAAGLTAEAFTFDGERRTYQLYVPASYAGTHAAPVVFEFHGYGSSAYQQVVYGDFRPLADQDGFLIVAPDGQGSPRRFNLTGEAGLQNDVAMVGALLDRVEATFCVDARRVYATGMSDGGGMSDLLACLAAERFAAFGPVALLAYAPQCPPHAISIVGFAGTADPIVPFAGGHVRCCGGALVGAAPDAMAGWARHDGCAATPTDEQLDTEVVRRTWSGCNGAVVFYIIRGGGHSWPGAIPLPVVGPTTTQVNASRVIWAFFQAHPLAA